MRQRTGRRAVTLMLMAGCAGLTLGAVPLAAQTVPPVDPAELDPSAPLDPMPDLGVGWPDMNVPDAAPVPDAEGAVPDAVADVVEANVTPDEDGATARRATWTISGLDGVDEAAAIHAEFEKRSVLQEERKADANAAQVDRRARNDAELLAELLRAQGYYDASVEPRIETRTGAYAVELAAVPGARYRFESVELPGLDQAAGDEAARLREAFAVKAGDPVVADKVIAAGVALQVALGDRPARRWPRPCARPAAQTAGRTRR